MEERLGNYRSFQCSSVKDPLLALRCSERLIRDYCSLLLRQQLSYRKIQSKAMRDWRTQWRCIEMQVAATCTCTRSWTQNLLYHEKKILWILYYKPDAHLFWIYKAWSIIAPKQKKASVFYSMHTSLASSVSILWQSLTVPGFSGKSWIKRSRRRPVVHIQMVVNTD